MNSIFHLPKSQDHPIVRGQYALYTPPIEEFIATICDWIDSRVPGGYIYGVSRLGKSRAVKFWVERRLSEKYRGALPFFRLIYKQHDRFSETELLLELLGASRHKYGKSNSRKIMLDRLVRLYAVRAKNAGGNHIVLMIDEAQDMRDPEYRTICNLQNELDSLGFQLTVISVGSQELTYQHEVFIQTGDIHLIARFMVRDAPFRGIRDAAELRYVRWRRLFGQVIRVFKWKNCSASCRRGCGNVKIGFIDFQGLVGRAENSSIVFRAFHETGISTACFIAR